jgi:hypothetical protein
LSETSQPESRKIMPRNASEREIGAQQSADRPEAKAMTREAGGYYQAGRILGRVDHR